MIVNDVVLLSDLKGFEKMFNFRFEASSSDYGGRRRILVKVLEVILVDLVDLMC